jgi:hypothetical protein
MSVLGGGGGGRGGAMRVERSDQARNADTDDNADALHCRGATAHDQLHGQPLDDHPR